VPSSLAANPSRLILFWLPGRDACWRSGRGLGDRTDRTSKHEPCRENDRLRGGVPPGFYLLHEKRRRRRAHLALRQVDRRQGDSGEAGEYDIVVADDG